MTNRITPAQVRGARGMLDWSMANLAKAASVSVSTVKRMENKDIGVLSDEIRSMVERAFEGAGIEFLADDGSGVGVRFRQR